MEKDSLNISKDTCDDGKSLTSNKGKVQESWDYRKHFHGEDLYSGFSWPPRSYTCSFCKREFRSAQALGGHMNVHRRDRARLRQSPPWEAQTSTLNPNPNLCFSSFASSPRVYSFPSIPCFSSPSSVYPNTELKRPSDALSPVAPETACAKANDLSKTMNTLKGFMHEDDNKTLMKGKRVMLDLEIGLGSDANEDLDLELRLGYS